MRLRPRHYILLAVIAAVAIYRMVQIHRARASHNAPVPVAVSTPPPVSPAWTAFDKAAALRDAAEKQFSPVLKDLQQTMDATKNDATIGDVKGCETWLLFYRQSVLHPSKDTTWKQRSTEHLDTCVRTHQDAG